MAFNLRYYQRGAIDAVYEFWRGGGRNPLIELATGTGKSGVAGTFCKELISGWPDMRIGCITHVKELIQQNAQEMLGIWPAAPIGIYSAGLGRRDVRSQILFGGIQSVYNKQALIDQGFDVLLVDEAHLIPRNSETMYGRFIDACLNKTPDMRIVGLTATPYRLGTGRLDEGEGAIFDRTVYTYGIGEGVADGYLAPLTSKRSHEKLDLTGIKKIGGDFAQGALEQAFMRDTDTVKAACAETVAYMREQRRRKLLVFCAGKAHAKFVNDEMNRLGVRSEVITDETQNRGRIIEQYRAGALECLVSVGVLTTGFNVKDVDIIALMLKTLSTGKYVQILGRGTRPVYDPGFNLDCAEGRRAAIASSIKPDCLVLDFGGNGEVHGPVDALNPPEARTPRERKPGDDLFEDEKITVDTVKGKYCPECETLLPVAARECADCGYLYPVTATHEATAGDAAVMKAEEVPEWQAVTDVHFARHEKPGGTPSFRVDYMMGLKKVSDWLCFEHTNGAREMAHKKWYDLRAEMPPPETVDDAIERADEIARPTEILTARDGQFLRVIGKRFGQAALPLDLGADLDDEIPF